MFSKVSEMSFDSSSSGKSQEMIPVFGALFENLNRLNMRYAVISSNVDRTLLALARSFGRSGAVLISDDLFRSSLRDRSNRSLINWSPMHLTTYSVTNTTIGLVTSLRSLIFLGYLRKLGYTIIGHRSKSVGFDIVIDDAYDLVNYITSPLNVIGVELSMRQAKLVHNVFLDPRPGVGRLWRSSFINWCIRDKVTYVGLGDEFETLNQLESYPQLLSRHIVSDNMFHELRKTKGVSVPNHYILIKQGAVTKEPFSSPSTRVNNVAIILPSGGGKTSLAVDSRFTDIDTLPSEEEWLTIMLLINGRKWIEVNKMWTWIILRSHIKGILLAHHPHQLPAGYVWRAFSPTSELHESNIFDRNEDAKTIARMNLKDNAQLRPTIFGDFSTLRKKILSTVAMIDTMVGRPCFLVMADQFAESIVLSERYKHLECISGPGWESKLHSFHQHVVRRKVLIYGGKRTVICMNAMDYIPLTYDERLIALFSLSNKRNPRPSALVCHLDSIERTHGTKFVVSFPAFSGHRKGYSPHYDKKNDYIVERYRDEVFEDWLASPSMFYRYNVNTWSGLEIEAVFGSDIYGNRPTADKFFACNRSDSLFHRYLFVSSRIPYDNKQTWQNSQTHWARYVSVFLRWHYNAYEDSIYSFRFATVQLLSPSAVLPKDKAKRVTAILPGNRPIALSGHLINLLLFSSIGVFDVARYLRTVEWNIKLASGEKFDDDIEFLYSNGLLAEDNAKATIRELWHSYLEYKFAVATYIVMCGTFNLPVDVRSVLYVLRTIERWRREYPRFSQHSLEVQQFLKERV